MNKKWFTLVEMLIVIVIIGILAAALIPRLTGIQSRARDVARAGDLNQIVGALAMYQLDNNGSYPSFGTGGVFEDATVLDDNDILGEYLKSFPSDPRGASAAVQYGYATVVEGNTALAAIAAVHESGKGNWSYVGTTYTELTITSQDNANDIAGGGNAQIVIQ